MSKVSYKKMDINALISLAQTGNIRALEELVRRVQKDIFAMFLHLTSKREEVADLTQEALLKMARALPQLKNVVSFKTWLNQIITNVYYDFVRKKPKDFIEIDEKELMQIKDKVGCEPGEKCLFSEIEKIVQAAFMTLPIDLRITLALREYEGLSYDDISKITNTAIGTVKSRISRARLKLQKELKEFM